VLAEGPGLGEPVCPPKLVAELDQEFSVDILVLLVAVRRWDGVLGGELAVICDVRSTASL